MKQALGTKLAVASVGPADLATSGGTRVLTRRLFSSCRCRSLALVTPLRYRLHAAPYCCTRVRGTYL